MTTLLGHSGLRRTVAPTFQVLTPSQLRAHARIDECDEDQLIAEYIEAATEYAESYQNRILRTSTWAATYDGFPCGEWYLPNPRLQSISSIAYLDQDGASQTLATTVYTSNANIEPGQIALKVSQVWPTTYEQIGVVTVTFVAGYLAADIPARTKQAIRILAAHWYRLREPIVIGASVQNVPMSVQDLLDADKFVAYR